MFAAFSMLPNFDDPDFIHFVVDYLCFLLGVWLVFTLRVFTELLLIKHPPGLAAFTAGVLSTYAYVYFYLPPLRRRPALQAM